jgi:superfamily II DNA/RNA helicase
VLALHGDMDQPARTAALEQFRRGEVTLLVASDVAARGLDIPDVSHIYNFDVPLHPDDYVHRIGRTGRAGRTGTAVTIVASSNDAKAVAAIEKLIGNTIPFMDDQALPAPAAAPAPAPQQTGAPQRQAPPQPRRPRPDGHRHAHRATASASVARAPQRPAQPAKPRTEEADTSHLPAFLLRPVPLKA